MKTWKSLMLGVCFGAFAQMSYAIPMLTWNADNTKVTGATGLEFGDSLFDMEFVDGSCITLFDGCDSDADFIVPGTGVTHGSLLTTFFDAFISQVLLIDDGSLDAQPSLPVGCEARAFCFTFAPIRLIVNPDAVGTNWISNYNFANERLDDIASLRITPFDEDTEGFIGSNYARFAIVPAGVPTPGSLALLALGLAGLGFRRKGKTSK